MHSTNDCFIGPPTPRCGNKRTKESHCGVLLLLEIIAKAQNSDVCTSNDTPTAPPLKNYSMT